MTNFKYHCLLSTLFLLLVINAPLTAQNPFDCIDAITVCDHSDISIDYDVVEGMIEEEIPSFCVGGSLGQDFLNDNTVWLKYQFVSNGNFLFTIIPEEENNDIDFVVFATETGSCDDLSTIRCMFSGPNVNGSMIEYVCVGPTGLSPSSDDTIETGGCLGEDDNFLAPVDVNEGDVLYLAVRAFSQMNKYTIEHGGSAEISCTPVGLDKLNSQEINIFPNPTQDILNIQFEADLGDNFKLELFNTAGTKVMIHDFSASTTLDISNLSTGIYYAKIWSQGSGIYYQKISKI